MSDVIELRLHRDVQLPGGLRLRLEQFTHKTPAEYGGPAKATAYLSVEFQGSRDVVGLSCTTHPGEGRPGSVDDDGRIWRNHEIQLVGFRAARVSTSAYGRRPPEIRRPPRRAGAAAPGRPSEAGPSG